MERRKFILSLVGTATVVLPLSQCSTANNTDQPQFLYSCIGKQRVKEIGKAYATLHKSEADKKQLKRLINGTWQDATAEQIKIQVEKEFREGKTLIINGWILSVTEARQSALYYLNS